MSLFINNRMNKTQANTQKAFTRLGSGKRIPNASHDAAGLSISEKMRALIRGSEQAHRNVQDAYSLVQTADGAMEEITEKIQRIRELTVQALSDTYSTTDKLTIQNEIDELKRGIGGIVHNTEFNTMKLLTNTKTGQFVTENRSVEKTITVAKNNNYQPVDVQYNKLGMNQLFQVVQPSNQNYQVNMNISTVTHSPQAYIGSTVVDYRPRWSSDGESIIFQSSRDNGQYIVPANGESDPEELIDTHVSTATRRTTSTNGLLQLRYDHFSSKLVLEQRFSTATDEWSQIQSYDYNYKMDGVNGYSFSPVVDEYGNTAFVFSDSEGNIQKVNVNIYDFSVSNPIEVIPNTDTLNIPPMNNKITLTSTPDVYRMNNDTASFRVLKVNDDGERELLYWDQSGNPPESGYYTLTGNVVEFFGDAIIGMEEVDDAQDFYRFEYVSSPQANIYQTSIPHNAEVYNMHGEEEPRPRSLNIIVGNKEVTREQLLSDRPDDIETTTGVFVDTVNNRIEIYGDLRPAYHETVKVQYMNDVDSRNEVYTFHLRSDIDTYNLEANDPDLNRSLIVRIDGQEVPYSDTNGYIYNRDTGTISLFGNYRPDVPSNPTLMVQFVVDRSFSNTDEEVYGIVLTQRPELYNLEGEDVPKSIRVYQNGVEVAYSGEDGFLYNQLTNTIELYGSSRPNVGDSYSIRLIAATGGVTRQDEIVEVELPHTPETYGLGGIPSTFRVIVDGNEIQFDESKTNGYFYNNQTNRIEIYGESRPDAAHPSNPDVRVYYVYENPVISTGNNTYDFRLAPNTAFYGVETEEEPRAIRVYYKGSEVPYSDENGFTYNHSTRILSLHGDYRPTSNDRQEDYKVYSIRESDLAAHVPNNVYVYKFFLNGEEIDRAYDFNGHGYFHSGQSVSIIGDARPNITEATNGHQLQVLYSDPLSLSLDRSAIPGFSEEHCEHNIGQGHLLAEINHESLVVSLNGNVLSDDQYAFNGGQITLNSNKVNLSLGSHRLSASYEARHPLSYDPNEFIFQVGANSGDSLKLEIVSFDNMLLNTNAICVTMEPHAGRSLQMIDDALSFVTRQRSHMGATMNRMDAIASILKTVQENTTASLSRIEDADMAKEMMDLVKQRLLTQVQVAISTQNQQSYHQVLDLLK